MPRSQLIAVGLLVVRCISEVMYAQSQLLYAGMNLPPLQAEHAELNLRQQATPPEHALRQLSSGRTKLSTRCRRQRLASTTSAASLLEAETMTQPRSIDREPRTRAEHKRRKQQQETTACNDAFACTTAAVSALSPGAYSAA